MVLVAYEKTWTFGLCYCFLLNMATVESFNADKKKDLVFVTDERVFQKNYRFEDFFWTGSEDEIDRENAIRNETDLEMDFVEASPYETWKTTTVFYTTTILFATVYPNSESCAGTEYDCTPKISPVQTKSIEFSMPTSTQIFPEIFPCPTQKVSPTDFPNILTNNTGIDEIGGVVTTPRFTKPSDNQPSFVGSDHNVTTIFPDLAVDQKYWITTILRSDNISRNLELNLIESKLSTLYKKALNRRQEKYFGGPDFQDRRDRKVSQPVKVNVLNATRSGKNIELLYYVSVADQPVPAMTAANDMRLMTASEVIAELGYPILSKAEPFIKNIVPLGARVKGRTRDTWLFIGSVIAAVLLLIILAALLAFELSKKRSKEGFSKESGKKKVFEEEKGTSNLAFEEDIYLDEEESTKPRRKTQTKPKDFKIGTQSSAVKFQTEGRRENSTSSSCSGSSEASLVRLRHQQKRREKSLKEKESISNIKSASRIRKNFERKSVERTGSAVSRNSFNETYDDPNFSPCMTRSPTSYLSMPSVRAFPRGTQIPEPLNKILEPISIRHLDADSDSPNEYPHRSQIRHKVDVEHVCEVKNKYLRKKAMTRHASLEGDDPGFIGPVVWKKHCQKVEGETDEINMEEVDENISIGRVRKRFNDLLDDAFSMFGSRNPSPEGNEGRSVKQTENRVHSAVVRPAGMLSDLAAGGRPKTTGSKRPQSAVVSGPKGAWETPSCSTLVRSDTATVFQKLSSSPVIDKNLIYVNSDLEPSDPAVPLIVAIKNELKKFENPPEEY